MAHPPMAQNHCHTANRTKIDWLLWGSLLTISISYLAFWWLPNVLQSVPSLYTFSQSSFELLNTMAWGIVIGIISVGLIDKIPRELVTSLLGRSGFGGLMRAVLAGVMLDLCSHGILMVGMKLYERGVRLGQVMAFLIASPWNSFSLTLILWALVGFKWMLAFLLLSMLIALITGFVFDWLVKTNRLPPNPNHIKLETDFKFTKAVKQHWQQARFDTSFFISTLKNGFSGSRMVLRWVFFGVILASLMRTFMSPEMFGTFFGPTLAGLGLTILVATILEVCSEGSTPIAADIVNRAQAPGNGFAFLMTGVSTDYTEIMSLRQTTKSWLIPLCLPLITLPQIVAIAWLINQFA